MRDLLCVLCLVLLVVAEWFLFVFGEANLELFAFATLPYALLAFCLFGLQDSTRALSALLCTIVPVVALGVWACWPEDPPDRDSMRGFGIAVVAGLQLILIVAGFFWVFTCFANDTFETTAKSEEVASTHVS
jgi:hypothetical protein